MQEKEIYSNLAKESRPIGAKELYLENKKEEKQAKFIEKEIESLLKDVKGIKELIDVDYEILLSKLQALKKSILTTQERPTFARFIPHFQQIFDVMSFDNCTEAQMCDLVKIYQSLDVFRTLTDVEKGDNQKEPTLYKILYQLGKLIEQGDEDLAKRWSKEEIERLWIQLY